MTWVERRNNYPEQISLLTPWFQHWDLKVHFVDLKTLSWRETCNWHSKNCTFSFIRLFFTCQQTLFSQKFSYFIASHGKAPLDISLSGVKVEIQALELSWRNPN